MTKYEGGILPKIQAIQVAVGTIPKNGKGPSSKGGFEFVKFDDVVQKLRDLFAENKVINTVNVVRNDTKSEQVGNRQVTFASIDVEYTYIDSEDGSSITTTVSGEGSDIGGDTATRKAFTQALKIALLQTFNIVTGEDPDSDGMTHEEAKPAKATTPAKVSQSAIQAKITAIIADKDNEYTSAMVNALGDEVTGKKSDVWFNNAADLQKVLDALEAKIKLEVK